MTAVGLTLMLLAAAAGSARPEVAFTRLGGIAGYDDRLTIDADGMARRQCASGEWVSRTLAQQQKNAIMQALATSDLFAADHIFAAVGADLTIYTIRYQEATVRADDDTMPARLRPAVTALTQLAEELAAACP